MTTQTLSGTYNSGYSLAAQYEALSITGTGSINGAAGLYSVPGSGGAGGTGLLLPSGGTLVNSGTIAGGVGGASSGNYYYAGGDGSAGVSFASSGTVANYGAIAGGAGGATDTYGGSGGAGGMALLLSGGGALTNTGKIAGGLGGASTGDYYASGGDGGAGVSLVLSGTVINYGTIAGGAGGTSDASEGSGGAGGAGLLLSSGGTLANTGKIAGGAGGTSGTQFGDGGAGGAGLLLSGADALNNTGTIAGGAGGSCKVARGVGGYGGAGLVLLGGGTLANTGTIIGGRGGSAYARLAFGGAGGDGVWLAAGGTVNNYSGGMIYGGEGFGDAGYNTNGESGAGVWLAAPGVVYNLGQIIGGLGRAAFGVELEEGGIVDNGASGTPSATIFGAVGVSAGAEGSTTVTNFGTIEGLYGGVAVQFENAGDRLIDEGGSTFIGAVQGGGGTLELAAGSGALAGLGGGFSGFGAVVVDADGNWTLSGKNTAQSLTIAGAVTLADKSSLTIQGDVVDSGQITLGATAHTTSLIVGKSGATLSGGGTVILGGDSLGRIIGASYGATLMNVDDTVTGSGQFGAGKMILINGAAGLIEQTGAEALSIDTGAKRITNDGLIEATGLGGATITGAIVNAGVLEADGGNLRVEGAVTGAGSAIIGGGVLTFAAGFNQSVTFTGPAGELALAQSQAFHGKISGFSVTGATGLDLRDIGFVSTSEASFSGNATNGKLTVTDGTRTAKITLVGDYLGSTWTAFSDFSGGVVVIDSPVGNRASPTTFAAAMAVLGGAGGGSAESACAAGWAAAPRLAIPGPH